MIDAAFFIKMINRVSDTHNGLNIFIDNYDDGYYVGVVGGAEVGHPYTDSSGKIQTPVVIYYDHWNEDFGDFTGQREMEIKEEDVDKFKILFNVNGKGHNKLIFTGHKEK